MDFKKGLFRKKEEKKFENAAVFLSAQHIDKVYSNRVKAVSDFSLDIKEGEFIVLVGPSGCGKSTTLRMIAGLEDITSGDLFIDGKYANKLEPIDRGVAMVFQSYALYPHMSVYENMAFGLTSMKILAPKLSKEGQPVLDEKGKPILEKRKLTSKEIEERIANAAKILQITEYLQRKPTELSGGQCQRVALGRAVVRNAKVFLLDEPLSNLDAKLRVQMRSELVKLHDALKNTMIYVTHDQTEAMTMADRIVILNHGVIQQIGTPREVYDHPANVFVATFMGSPTMNVLPALYKNGVLTFKDGTSKKLLEAQTKAFQDFYQKQSLDLNAKLKDLHLKQDALTKDPQAKSTQKAALQKEIEMLQSQLSEDEKAIQENEIPLLFGIRPEDMKFSLSATMGLPVTIEVSELLGSEYSLHFSIAKQEVVARVPSEKILKIGDKGMLDFPAKQIHLFDQRSEKIIF
jgi:multiple sugar transport system ATP-binding protein